MERLCDRVRQQSVGGGGEGGDHHLCFLGSGRESEDQYMHMVVAKFLQKSISYISFARGGFLGQYVYTSHCNGLYVFSFRGLAVVGGTDTICDGGL